MKVIETDIDGVLIVEPDVFGDERGFFMETYHTKRYREHGIGADFVQDNYSFSRRGILRGLHFQLENAQAKLVQVLQGQVFDVAVDVRYGSPTFGKWVGVTLSDANHRQFFVPEGFAHGFCVLSDTARFVYKCSDYYNPEKEGGVFWADPDLKIDWPVSDPVLSEKDTTYSCLKDLSPGMLPQYRG